MTVMEMVHDHQQPRSSTSPYLSIVATARNDHHGGDLLGRMQHFVDGLIEQSARFGLDAELVLMEWNPPVDKPGLAEALNWSTVNDHAARLRVRIIQVPEMLHQRFRYSERLPLFQMIAKNAGIRRSRGAFILATNIDILFSDELIAFLARRKLRKGRLYRADRYDIDPAPPPSHEMCAAERLKWAREHVIRINERRTSTDLRRGEVFRVLWKSTWRVRLLEALQNIGAVPVVTRRPLHTNACGDFTLLHRDHWYALRGYAEMERYSMHIDSLFCFAAAESSGLKETVLRDPMRIYHIEHETGSGFTPENVEALNSRLARTGIPQLSHDELNRLAIRMRKERTPILFNEENQWGLADDELVEIDPMNHSSERTGASAPDTRQMREEHSAGVVMTGAA